MTDPNLIAILLGAGIGFLMAITGAGGAILSLPLLMYFFNMEIQDAAPVALVAIFIAAGSAALIGLKQGIVRYKAAALLAVMGVLMAPLGVYVAHSVTVFWLHLLFMLLLFYVGTQALVAAKKSNLVQDSLYHLSAAPCEINPVSAQLFWTASCTKKLLLTGAVAGFLSGLLGVGGGFIVMPVLQKISNLNYRMVVATSLTMTALVALVSVISYASYSAIQWHIAIPFALATLAGSLAGKFMATTISISQSRLTFGIVSLFIALAMLLNMLF